MTFCHNYKQTGDGGELLIDIYLDKLTSLSLKGAFVVNIVEASSMHE